VEQTAAPSRASISLLAGAEVCFTISSWPRSDAEAGGNPV
jgi:hypothetical protein